MKCIECGKGRLKLRTADVASTFRGENISVRAHVEVCNNCGFQLVRPEDLGELTRLLADEYRRRHGLLTSAQIRERRQKLRMSQEAFAGYLGVGVASVKRWELGLVQDKAMNELMLLKTDAGKAEDHVRTLRRMLRQPAEPPGRKVTARPA